MSATQLAAVDTVVAAQLTAEPTVDTSLPTEEVALTAVFTAEATLEKKDFRLIWSPSHG
ncbi:hypothetical protein DMR_37640 [Solidesulfovibrio magneticus RS-1]|uniref:Uncharacterized protein n=1 Tax=Solidesulfovibrio magneticus (strain ATCC 700980 / DSM 13731 / RS-1) TaxID=573370 RepID=C4XMC9_SOLM1|nr:hypothetical protein DMR_37640 [Solidesulfovibrio magneticus RS-1]